MMPAFSVAIATRQPGPPSVWSRPTLVTTATCAVGHVGGVVAAEQADLDDGDVDREVGEPAEGGGGEDLEVATGRTPGQVLDRGDRADLLAELVVVDRLAVPHQPLVDPLEVRARVGADREAAGPQQRGDHPGGRALAVRAR